MLCGYKKSLMFILLLLSIKIFSQSVKIDSIYRYSYYDTRGGAGYKERFIEWKKDNSNSKIKINEQNKKEIEKIINSSKINSFHGKVTAKHYVFEFVILGKSTDVLYSWDWFEFLTTTHGNKVFHINKYQKRLLIDFFNELKKA